MKLYGLIGYPLGHSFSKKYFTDKFRQENISNACFELFPIDRIESFPSLLQEHKNLLGLAVTIPYKESVINYLDTLSENANAVGAVNCISIHKGELKGHNTDVIGFENSIGPLLQKHHRQALILGTGGSSKAVQFVLKKMNIEYKVVSRYQNKNYITYNEICANMYKDSTIIINCTPIGMNPYEDQCPAIDYDNISEDHLLYDLIYNPSPTLFLKKGKERGAIIKSGLEMLQLQAEENWRIWNAS